MASPCEDNGGKILSGAEIIRIQRHLPVDIAAENKTLYICSFDRGRWKWVQFKQISQKNYKKYKDTNIDECIKGYRFEKRPSHCHPIKISGATGSNAHQINGTFYPQPQEKKADNRIVYLRHDNNLNKRWLYWVPAASKWRLGNTRYKNERKAVGWLRNIPENGIDNFSPWEIPVNTWKIWDGADNQGSWNNCPAFKIELVNDELACELERKTELLQKANEIIKGVTDLNDKYREVSAILFNKINKKDKLDIINSVAHLKMIFKKENICSSCFSCKTTTPCVHFDCPGACEECRKELDVVDKCCACGKSQKMQCPVCFDTFTTDHLEIFKCRHCICLRCYLTSYKVNKNIKKCPTCRAVIEANQVLV